jgi:hypothetical protein
MFSFSKIVDLPVQILLSIHGEQRKTALKQDKTGGQYNTTTYLHKAKAAIRIRTTILGRGDLDATLSRVNDQRRRILFSSQCVDSPILLCLVQSTISITSCIWTTLNPPRCIQLLMFTTDCFGHYLLNYKLFRQSHLWTCASIDVTSIQLVGITIGGNHSRFAISLKTRCSRNDVQEHCLAQHDRGMPTIL